MTEALVTMSARKRSKRRSGISDVSDAGLAGGAMVALRVEYEIEAGLYIVAAGVYLIMGVLWAGKFLRGLRLFMYF